MKMQKMSQNGYEAFRTYSVGTIAQMRSEETDKPVSEVMDEAAAEFERYASQGLETPDVFLYQLHDSDDTDLGFLWFRIRTRGNKKTLFILDIHVNENARGKGCGKFMMKWLETEAARLAVPEISLHVVGGNHVARKLYASLGYEITNLYLSKRI